MSLRRARDKENNSLDDEDTVHAMFPKLFACGPMMEEADRETIKESISGYIPLTPKVTTMVRITSSGIAEIPTVADFIVVQSCDPVHRADFVSSGKPNAHLNVDSHGALVQLLQLGLTAIYDWRTTCQFLERFPLFSVSRMLLETSHVQINEKRLLLGLNGLRYVQYSAWLPFACVKRYPLKETTAAQTVFPWGPCWVNWYGYAGIFTEKAGYSNRYRDKKLVH